MSFKFYFEWVGYLLTLLWLLTFLWGIFLWARRILPMLIRLGKGLALRKIAVFASDNEQHTLIRELEDSDLFYKRNIISITKEGDLELSQKASIFLIHWPSWGVNIDAILNNKKEGTGIIVYAPHGGGTIPKSDLIKINQRRSASIVNFRGRLISDIVMLMMTTKIK